MSRAPSVSSMPKVFFARHTIDSVGARHWSFWRQHSTRVDAAPVSAAQQQYMQVTKGIGVVRTPCVQAEADVVIGLTRLDAERLYGMRQQVLDLKLAVLREAENRLRSA